ncbi:pentatricopeptide repeat-containing protein 1, mitochondrial-like isoform X2 [Stylophora pistillata]|uniref:pentatricopeptide repeat-containing protein 1, mitochondrial-like isoform X2 n=1 Tax=Stylophora pistillata TaxID=50429 RepID=UPI000C04C498|nr:pentatricopeptide repeat-containing protein 1, mitochondrial-like isoform X2 [Stylophora pistillata]
MAVSASRVRYHRLPVYWFVRLCSESGYPLSHIYPQRRSLSLNGCQMYSKSSSVMAKKLNQTGTRRHALGFDKTKSLLRSHHIRDDRISGTRSKDRKVLREEDDPESDPETEDEGELNRISYKELKSQKSGKGSLRPSRYMFREVGATGEEENQWERKNAAIDRKGKVNWYARQMLRLSQEGKVDDALKLLSSMKEDKLNPKIEVYNIFISAYAKSREVKKAFKLYNDVKKWGLRPTAYTYSSLFYACTQAQVTERTLERVEKLYTEISLRVPKDELEMNLITYNAAIQAFAVCGNPDRVFDVYQEMRKNKFVPDEYTFTSLLAACCLDPDEGPRLAFQLLEEMKWFRLRPNIYIYNSVLKVMRNFKLSQQKQTLCLPKDAKSPVKGERTSEHETRFDGDSETSDSEINYEFSSSENHLQEVSMLEKQNDKSVELQDYFPGVEKFIQIMALEDVNPDIRTFQMLLHLTASKSEEGYLMNLMKSCKITPDAIFFHSIIKTKALEGDLKQAKEYMNQLQEKLKFSPSEASYQALACGCRNQNQGLALLDDMEAEGITAGQSVYGTLIAGAAKLRQFTYLVKLVKDPTSHLDMRPPPSYPNGSCTGLLCGR